MTTNSTAKDLQSTVKPEPAKRPLTREEYEAVALLQLVGCNVDFMGLYGLHVHRSVNQESKREDYASNGPDCNNPFVFSGNDKRKGHYIRENISCQGNIQGAERVAGIPCDDRVDGNGQICTEDKQNGLDGKNHRPESTGTVPSQRKLDEEQNRIGHQDLCNPDNEQKRSHLKPPEKTITCMSVKLQRLFSLPFK